MIYLDHAATTQPFEEVLDSFIGANQQYYFNAASIHEGGRNANKLLEAARKQVLDILNMKSYELIFTGGATESNNIVIQSVVEKKKKFGKTVLVSELEHPSVVEVLRNMKDINLKFIQTTHLGTVDLEHLKQLMTDDVIFVSVIALNNIIGSIQPIEEIIDIVTPYKRAFLHVDATQAIGKIEKDYNGVDALTLSAHKFYGLKGIGGLIIKDKNLLSPIMYGGGHENNIRSGTVNVAGAVSLAKALRLAVDNLDYINQRLTRLNDKIRTHFKDYKALYFQPKHAPAFINMSFNGAKGEVVVNALSKRGIYVSTTSACASQREELNETLIALKNKASIIEGSIRITMGQKTTESEIDQLIIAIEAVYRELGDVLYEV